MESPSWFEFLVSCIFSAFLSCEMLGIQWKGDIWGWGTSGMQTCTLLSWIITSRYFSVLNPFVSIYETQTFISNVGRKLCQFFWFILFESLSDPKRKWPSQRFFFLFPQAVKNKSFWKQYSCPYSKWSPQAECFSGTKSRMFW